jgi:flagellin-like protein
MKETLQTTLDERAVSPAIGVILMVAITVILAAVIGSFVLGIGGDIQQAPQASLSLEDASTTNNVTLSHNGGDELTLSDFKFTVDGAGGATDISSHTGTTSLGPGGSIELDTGGSGGLNHSNHSQAFWPSRPKLDC